MSRTLRALKYNIKSRSWDGIKHLVKWDTRAGELSRGISTWIGIRMMVLSRHLFRWSLGRCSWCGRNCGLNSSISRKGLRCSTFGRDCSKEP